MSENRHMRTRRIAVIALSVAMTLGVAGCAASTYVDPIPKKPQTPSLNEVRDTSEDQVESIVGNFGDAEVVSQVENVYECQNDDAEPGVGQWIIATSFFTDNIPQGIGDIRSIYEDSETAYGTTGADLTYKDGSTWVTPGAHLVLESKDGSHTFSFPNAPSGAIIIRTVTSCGTLN